MRPAVPVFSRSFILWDSLLLMACPSSSTDFMREGQYDSLILLHSKRKLERSHFLPPPGWSTAAGHGRSTVPLDEKLRGDSRSRRKSLATERSRIRRIFPQRRWHLQHV